MFVPAILFDSFGAGLSVEAIKTLWVVAVIGLLTAPLSALVSYPGMVLSRPPVWFREWFMFGATFQNTVALPLVLIQTICSQVRAPNRDESGAVQFDSNGTVLYLTQPECQTKGELYIFMYVFLHSLLFWVVAYDVMPSKPKTIVSEAEQQDQDQENVPKSQSPEHDMDDDELLIANGETLIDRRDDRNGNQVASTSSTVLSTVSFPELKGIPGTKQTFLDDNPVSESRDPVTVYMSGNIASAISVQKRPSKLSQDDYIAGSFYGGMETMAAVQAVGEDVAPTAHKNQCQKIKAKTIWLIFHILSLCARPPIIAQLVGMFIGLIKPLQEAFFSPTSVLRPLTLSIKIFAVASTAVTNLSMSGGLGLKMKEIKVKHLFGGDAEGLSKRTTFGFVFTRMIVIPAVLFGLTYLLQIYQLVPQDRLLLMVLYMQTMMPSANMCVVVPQILGNHQASGALSLLVLSQYIVALPSMLLWMSLAFYVTKDIL